jgi:thiamine biosynthesis lipoprotein
MEPTAQIIRARPLLGTLVQIQATGPAPTINGAVDCAFAAVEHVQRLMSYHDPASELSMLNREAARAPCRVHADTFRVLTAALAFARLSEGAFDPCVGGELERWGYLPTHDSWSSGQLPLNATWNDVELLSERQVRFHRPLRLDLGGIAKGYAVDQAVRALQAAGASNVLVNAGGDLRVAGALPRTISLRHPLAPEATMHTVILNNGALATSGAYYSRRRHRGEEVSELVIPHRRTPYLGAGSVSVRAADCMSADALTKVVLIAPAPVAERALASCAAEAFVQLPTSAPDSPRSGPPRLEQT